MDRLGAIADPERVTDLDMVWRAIGRRSFCTLATSGARNRPLVAGVLYAVVDRAVVVSTLPDSAKARHLRQNPRAAVCVPMRRYPFGPPFTAHFQAAAEFLDLDEVRACGSRLKKITSHGEIEHGSVFVRLTPTGRITTYGLGVSLRQILRDPLSAVRQVDAVPRRP